MLLVVQTPFLHFDQLSLVVLQNLLLSLLHVLFPRFDQRLDLDDPAHMLLYSCVDFVYLVCFTQKLQKKLLRVILSLIIYNDRRKIKRSPRLGKIEEKML